MFQFRWFTWGCPGFPAPVLKRLFSPFSAPLLRIKGFIILTCQMVFIKFLALKLSLLTRNSEAGILVWPCCYSLEFRLVNRRVSPCCIPRWQCRVAAPLLVFWVGFHVLFSCQPGKPVQCKACPFTVSVSTAGNQGTDARRLKMRALTSRPPLDDGPMGLK